MHRPIHSQTHTLGTGGGSATQEVQELDRERLRCVVPERGLEGQLPLPLCRRPPQGKYTGRRHLSWVEPSFCTASSEAALAGRGRPAPPPINLGNCPTQPTNCPPWPVARQSAPPYAFPELHIHGQAAALSLCHLHPAGTLQERLLGSRHWCQPKLQCLSGRTLGSAGSR